MVETDLEICLSPRPISFGAKAKRNGLGESKSSGLTLLQWSRPPRIMRKKTIEKKKKTKGLGEIKLKWTDFVAMVEATQNPAKKAAAKKTASKKAAKKTAV